MTLTELIDQLSRPGAYPFESDRVDVVQTHISVVFLVGDRAYKIKKPVDLGFLDFTSLDKRHHFCQEEVRLNRRGAPDVYLGVEPIVSVGDALAVGADGEVVEWAVEMRRLPEDRTLRSLLESGELDSSLLQSIGTRIARFHEAAEAGVHLAEHGGWNTVAFNVRENFEQLEPFLGQSIEATVHARLSALSEMALAELQPLIQGRAERGLVCDTHGDLHLAHIYSFPGEEPPADFLLVDCIEFNARFRYADPVADVAFLAMDLRFHGRPDLSQQLVDSYFDATGDDQGRQLLEFYVAYRAVVRGKVESFALLADEIPESDRQQALARARPYMLLALGALAAPADKPCVVVSGGLPGTGKSWLARGLEDRAGFVRISTDRTRKRLAGVPAGDEANVTLGAEHYSGEWTDRTYEACLDAAQSELRSGRRVVIDGTFRSDRQRRRVSELARRWAVPARMFVCDADPAVVKERLDSRPPSASDAGWEVYQALESSWEAPSEDLRLPIDPVNTMGDRDETLQRALRVLVEQGLA